MYFIDSLKRISILLEIKYNNQSKDRLNKLRLEAEKEYKKIIEKDKYLEMLKCEKDRVDKRIIQIKDTLDDDEKIKKEYEKRNEKLPLEKKIFSKRVLLKVLIEEKNQLIERSKEIENLSKEETYNKNLEDIKEKLRYLRLVVARNQENIIKELLIIMQKIFLQGMNGKINQANNRDEIIKLIYQFRYYCMIPINEEVLVYQNEELNEELNSVGRFLLEKACITKTVSLFSENEDINYNILQNIYITRIISLEELNIKITKEKEKYYVQLFDENIFDEKIEINANRNVIKTDFTAKINKKVKLFI